MAGNRQRKSDRGGDLPVEINMTDLEGEERRDLEEEAGGIESGGDRHAVGTPLGGTASGGLAGTNVGDGSPEGVDLEGAMGSGIHDNGGERDTDETPAFGGSG